MPSDRNSDLFQNQREITLESTIAMVEGVLIERGHVVDDARTEIEGASHAWSISSGAVEIRLIDRESFPHLRVSATILELKDDAAREGLYEKLLSLNATSIVNAAFALSNDTVLLLTERSTRDLDRSEVQDLIGRIESYAKTYTAALA